MYSLQKIVSLPSSMDASPLTSPDLQAQVAPVNPALAAAAEAAIAAANKLTSKDDSTKNNNGNKDDGTKDTGSEVKDEEGNKVKYDVFGLPINPLAEKKQEKKKRGSLLGKFSFRRVGVSMGWV